MKTTDTHRPAAVAAGFTLVEILVVIGIIVILAAILVPMIGRAMRQAKQTRTAADMQAIATALEAFKADHGDYPRFDYPNAGAGTLGRYLNGPFGNTTWDDDNNPSTPEVYDPRGDPPQYDGAKSYLPGDTVRNGNTINDLTWVCVQPSTGNAPPANRNLASATPYWTFAGTTDPTGSMDGANDGADGPSLRIRGAGKKYGPYITVERMAMRGLAFIDGNGNPILYFPGRPGGSRVYNTADAYVGHTFTMPGTKARAEMKWNADDNFDPFRRSATEPTADVLRRIRTALGDTNGDGGINVNPTDGETANAPDAPYILWAAGTDGKFGPDIDANPQPTATWDRADWDRCDDVTNFR